MSDRIALGPGAEFDAIRAMLAQWGDRAAGIGDDAAVLSVAPGERVVASTDTSVDGVHFRRDWITPREIGWRATMAALSDLAAMGARPMGVLSAITVPVADRALLPELAAGMGDAAAACGAPIVGGDLSQGATLSITVTVLGAAAAPVSRSGARPGDALWVTGTLGGPAAAIRHWLAGVEPDAPARARFAHPVARIAEGEWLAAHGAHAAIDVSDGLVADARHLAVASGVLIEIALELVPVLGSVTAAEAAASGEEYELLVAAPESLDVSAFPRDGGPLTRIGRVLEATATPGVAVTSGGARVEFTAGYDHFSR